MEIFELMAGLVGLLGFLPWLLSIAAVFDAIDKRAGWPWFLVIFFFPMLGPLVYFAVFYGPEASRRHLLSEPAARSAAKRRLREIKVQLTHWRGPALLAEAGEQLLLLGKPAQAEAHLREAIEVGAPIGETHYRLARVLAELGRFAEAIPLLDALLAVEPDPRLGEARLLLARCLDEAGEAERAEATLEEVLRRRKPLEAKVRLARLLLRRGADAEARELLAEIESDGQAIPPYLRRLHRPWIKAARKLQRGRLLGARERLPRQSASLASPLRSRLILIPALMLLLAGFLGYQLLKPFLEFSRIGTQMMEIYRQQEQLRELDRRFPFSAGDLGQLEIDPARLEKYLAWRRGLRPAIDQTRAVGGRVAPVEDEEDLEVGGQGSRDWQEARMNLLMVARQGLEQAGMGLAEAGAYTTLIDWRLLERPQALVLGLPAELRGHYLAVRWQRDHPSGPEAPPSLDAYEKVANDRQLAPGTAALLAKKREELAALPEEDLAYLEWIVEPVIELTPEPKPE